MKCLEVLIPGVDSNRAIAFATASIALAVVQGFAEIREILPPDPLICGAVTFHVWSLSVE